MLVALIARSLSLLLAGLVALAIVHKVRVLAQHREGTEPVIASSSWRRTHARSLLVAATVVESAIVALLVIDPPMGLVALALLSGCYGLALRSLPLDQGCQCFGSVLEAQSRPSAIRRNMVITGVSLVASAGYATGELPLAAVSEDTIGVAFVALAAFAGQETLKRFTKPFSEGGSTHGFQ